MTKYRIGKSRSIISCSVNLKLNESKFNGYKKCNRHAMSLDTQSWRLERSTTMNREQSIVGANKLFSHSPSLSSSLHPWFVYNCHSNSSGVLHPASCSLSPLPLAVMNASRVAFNSASKRSFIGSPGRVLILLFS